MIKDLTTIIEREGDGYVSLCPELDIASQGYTLAEARNNLQEALELFFETAGADEIHTRLHNKKQTTITFHARQNPRTLPAPIICVG